MNIQLRQKNKIAKKQRRKNFLRRAAKWHGFLTFAFILIYLATAIIFDPRFIIRDLKNKYAQAANVSVTLRIIGPPGKPSVSATPGCDNTSPYVDLDWNDTTDTDSYDINRNTLPLITGLTDSDYQDDNVNRETSYTYQVVANGPLGSTASDDVTATTGECPEQEDATCTIRTMNSKKISSYSGMPQTTDQTPKFTGTTNIENADIDIRVSSNTIIHASTSANDNGYWSWTTNEDLDYGTHEIHVTATDPNDESYTEDDDLTFKVIPEEEPLVPSTPTQPTQPPQPPEEIIPPSEETTPITEVPSPAPPVEMFLDVTSPDDTVYTGNNLNTELVLKNPDGEKKEITITYTIYDSNDKVISTYEEKITLEKEETLSKKFEIPRLTTPGKYRIEAKIHDGDSIVCTECFFEIKEAPLISLGTGFTLTLTEIMQKLSWIILILLLILIFLLGLLGYEHHLTKKALFNITENILRGKNYFTNRKGVAR